ncbi:hypothetical protein K469DRAFT_723246 [Zopfia rhizophila CBS 207.26]|uniref:C2H2-type domain-containing protein n=1 Tax=Zopfia rhizophila CBS 207.26 TaxID=1314779 RepID=A0A6A6DEH5_9PEZI|nr:hypothetical protein K469DRAFT_723246 [Zopfia rhizophila CBS 207.26]
MTPRSPKQQAKTSTISRRLRFRADQNLSVQPPELPQLRTLRSRRAATLPSTRRISVNYQPEEAHSPLWDPSEILDPFPRGNTSHPTGLEENPTSGLLLSQPLEFTPYHSPQCSPTELVPISTQSESEHYEVPPSSGSDLLPSPLSSLSGSHTAAEYELRLSTEAEDPRDHSVELQDMSTLGFMMPAQYEPLPHYGSPPSLESPSYSTMNQQQYPESRPAHQQPQTSAAYAPTYTSSPALQSQNPQRRSGDHATLPPYQSSVPRSPYQLRASPTPPMNYSPASSDPPPMLSSAPPTYGNYTSIHNLPGQSIPPLGSNTSSYPPSLPPTMYPTSTTAAYPTYEPQGGLAPPNHAPIGGLSSSPGTDRGGNGVMPRVLNSRPKPQCWEHGCNGRQFSTFSNLLRHQREKSGTAAKSYCPRCGAEFTRTTARNGHMAHEKCKPRRTSDTSR